MNRIKKPYLGIPKRGQAEDSETFERRKEAEAKGETHRSGEPSGGQRIWPERYGVPAKRGGTMDLGNKKRKKGWKKL